MITTQQIAETLTAAGFTNTGDAWTYADDDSYKVRVAPMSYGRGWMLLVKPAMITFDEMSTDKSPAGVFLNFFKEDTLTGNVYIPNK